MPRKTTIMPPLRAAFSFRRAISAVLASLLLVPVGPARADVFDLATGIWGIEEFDDMTCANNPHAVTFDPARRQAVIQWQEPVHNSDGAQVLRSVFKVIWHRRDRIGLRGADGKQAVMLLKSDNEYTWGVPGTASKDFYGSYRRCTDTKVSS